MSAAGHRFDPTILREYDIRGIVGETLHADDARALGRAYAVMLRAEGGRRVAVGRDGRLSSPMLYFAGHTLGVDGALMVTGSHNPANHNGFKLMMGKRSVYGADIQRLGQIASAGDFPSGAGKVEERPVRDAYLARLLQDYRGGRSLRVAWDSGNGATGEMVELLTAALPGEHFLLNTAIDGRFPAHHPDPTEPKNLVQLQAAVTEGRRDLGIAFDGDGDRIGVIDGEGRILWGDQLMVVLAKEVIADRPGAQIIADVKASQVLFDEIARMGGKPLMWRTGHSLIKAKMAQTGAPLAGEMSGHIFYADRYYGYDDALYAAVRLLGIASRSTATLAQMRRQLPAVVNTPELRIPCDDTRKFAVIDEVKERLSAAGAQVSVIDGVRVKSATGWWLLRASNTQAVLVARVEAADHAGLTKLAAELATQLSASGVTLPPIG